MPMKLSNRNSELPRIRMAHAHARCMGMCEIVARRFAEDFAAFGYNASACPSKYW